MKKITLGIFVLTCFLQWYIPAAMIWEQENTVNTGVAFKFKTIPIDPNDPFRGKYITLNYEASRFIMYDSSKTINLKRRTEKVYVVLETDAAGFAKVKTVLSIPPIDTPDYTTAYISYTRNRGDSIQLQLKYPFEKYFMEETKAKKAEDLHRALRRDSSQSVYGLVSIKEGNAALMDVQVNGVSIKDLVNKE